MGTIKQLVAIRDGLYYKTHVVQDDLTTLKTNVFLGEVDSAYYSKVVTDTQITYTGLLTAMTMVAGAVNIVAIGI